jgi:hypothetical protein
MRVAVNTLTPEDKPVGKQARIEQIRQPVLIQAHDEPAMTGLLLGKHFTPAQRYKRAALYWSIMWLLAGVSALIPIVHFVLVPIFAIAGPVLGYLKYRQKTISEAIEGKCPACRQEIRLPLDQQTTLPHRDVCPHCDKHIQIQVLDHEA